MRSALSCLPVYTRDAVQIALPCLLFPRSCQSRRSAHHTAIPQRLLRLRGAPRSAQGARHRSRGPAGHHCVHSTRSGQRTPRARGGRPPQMDQSELPAPEDVPVHACEARVGRHRWARRLRRGRCARGVEEHGDRGLALSPAHPRQHLRWRVRVPEQLNGQQVTDLHPTTTHRSDTATMTMK